MDPVSANLRRLLAERDWTIHQAAQAVGVDERTLKGLLAGRGGKTIQTGRHVRYEKRTPLNNLFLSLLERMDVQIDRLGDSTGKLDRLTT